MHWFSIIIVWVTQLLGFCKCVFNSFTERLTNWYVLWGIFLLFDQFLLDVILFNIFPMMNHYPTGFSSKCILIHVVLWKTKILVRAWMWIFNWVIYGACKKKDNKVSCSLDFKVIFEAYSDLQPHFNTLKTK